MYHPTRGNPWHFGIKAHIGVDADSGLVHSVSTTVNEPDVDKVALLLHARNNSRTATPSLRSRTRKGSHWQIVDHSPRC